MNFLALAQRCATECGVSGSLTTTAGQVGSLARIVNWVGDAWNEIQAMRDDWDWMRASSILGSGVSFTPAAGQYTTPLGSGAPANEPDGTEYFDPVLGIPLWALAASSTGWVNAAGSPVAPSSLAPAGQIGIPVDSFGRWDMETFRCNTTANGFLDEIFLTNVPFDVWRDSYMLGAMRNVQSRPYVIACGPDQSLNLAPPPNGLYTITGDYWVAPSLMAADTDVPVGLPLRWHMLIVYRAMLKYGYYEAAEDVISRAQSEWGIMYGRLEAARLPGMAFAGSLA